MSCSSTKVTPQTSEEKGVDSKVPGSATENWSPFCESAPAKALHVGPSIDVPSICVRDWLLRIRQESALPALTVPARSARQIRLVSARIGASLRRLNIAISFTARWHQSGCDHIFAHFRGGP